MPVTQFLSKKASVRLALPSELPVISHVLTLAFARDPALNWFGCVKDMIPDHNSTSSSAVKTMEHLNKFMFCLCKLTLVVGGVITVVVIPGEDKESGAEKGSRKETIVATALWLKPGQKLDSSVWNFVRINPWKLLLGWGWQGMKRIFFELSEVERTLEQSFQSQGLKPIDSWHLVVIAVDPNHEGQGYCSLMMKEGFTRTTPYPVHLEATTAKSRNVYAHFKFEVDEEHQFGKGQVDANGLAAQGERATGYPEWVMTKWHY